MSVSLQVEHYTACFEKIWNDCSGKVPCYGESFAKSDKMLREKHFEKFIESLNNRTNRKEINEQPVQKMTPLARGLFKSVFNYCDEQLDIILSEGYKQKAVELLDRVDTGVHSEAP